MAMAKFVRRVVTAQALTASSTTTIPLYRDRLVKALRCKLVTSVTGTGLAAANLKGQAPFDILPNIQVQAGGVTLVNRSLLGVAMQNAVDYGRCYNTSVVTSTTNITWTTVFNIDLALPRTYQYEREYLLPAYRLDTFNLIVQRSADVAQSTIVWQSGYPTTVSATSVTLTVDQVDYASDDKALLGARFKEYHQTENTINVAAATTRYNWLMDTGSKIRGILIGSTGGSSAALAEPIATIVGDITAEFASLRFLGQADAVNMAGQNIQAYNINDNCYALKGFYYVDFSVDGLESQFLDTSKMNRLELALNLAHPSTVDTVYIWPQLIY
jgi:hypothetical protein